MTETIRHDPAGSTFSTDIDRLRKLEIAVAALQSAEAHRPSGEIYLKLVGAVLTGLVAAGIVGGWLIETKTNPIEGQVTENKLKLDDARAKIETLERTLAQLQTTQAANVVGIATLPDLTKQIEGVASQQRSNASVVSQQVIELETQLAAVVSWQIGLIDSLDRSLSVVWRKAMGMPYPRINLTKPDIVRDPTAGTGTR